MTKNRNLLLALAILIGWAGAINVVHAQTDPADSRAPEAGSEDTEDPEDVARARAVYDAGDVAFSEGHFNEAARLFLRAYELSARPTLLYNVAVAYDRAGHDAEAIQYYEDFLEHAPDSNNEAYIRSRLEVLRRRVPAEAPAETPLEEDSADPSPPDAEPEPSIEDESSSLPVGAIVAFSVAGASAIAGGVVAAMALGIRSDLDAQCPDRLCVAQDRDEAERMGDLALTSDILFGVAIVGVITGVILLATGGDEEVPPVSASCDGSGCMLTAHAAF